MAHPQRQYKLVALDMDGTLLNRHHAISQRNRDTLLALAARGVGIAICTGRSTPCALPPLAAFQGAEHNFSLVTFNGACSYSKVVTGDGRGERNLLYSCPVPGSVTDRIFDIALQHDFVVNVYRGENIYACCRTDEHRTLCGRYQALTSCSYEYIDDRYAQFRGQEFSKVLVLASEPSLDALSELLRSLAPEAHLVRGNFFIEVLHPRVNKGAGLVGLCKKLNVSLADVVAFGDGDNDAEFLAAAGLGVAMLNGTAMAKQNAVCVSAKDHDDDGVAVELERIFAETLQSGASGFVIK